MAAKDKTEELYTDFHSIWESIKKREGMLGFILRNSKSASVDINDPAKIMDYAILSAESVETGEVTSEIFELGSINSIIVEGKDTKILTLITGEQRLSIFMDKKVDHTNLLKELDIPKSTQRNNTNTNEDNEEKQEKTQIEV